jgi:hypothetical protein
MYSMHGLINLSNGHYFRTNACGVWNIVVLHVWFTSGPVRSGRKEITKCKWIAHLVQSGHVWLHCFCSSETWAAAAWPTNTVGNSPVSGLTAESVTDGKERGQSCLSGPIVRNWFHVWDNGSIKLIPLFIAEVQNPSSSFQTYLKVFFFTS